VEHGFLIFVGVSVQFAVDHGGAHVIGVDGELLKSGGNRRLV
jgi:hypothetical protein